MLNLWAFDNIEYKHTLYLEEDYMKKFCTSLREHATNVINFEKKKMPPLTKREKKLHQDATECYICGKRFSVTHKELKLYEILGHDTFSIKRYRLGSLLV